MDLGSNGQPAGLAHSRAAARLGTALWEAFPGHVALLDRDGTVVAVNRAWRRFGLARGASPTVGLGMNYLHVCDRAADLSETAAAEAGDLVRAALVGNTSDQALGYFCGDEQESRWFRMQAIPLPGRHTGVLVVHHDVTADTEREQRWRHLALHDPLTGLPNRALLHDRLRHAIATAERNPASLAVLFIDLDDFKSVNDRFGHATGDRVLREVAHRLAGSVRAADTLGRWGGDEFLIIAERLDTETTAYHLADRLADGLRDPIRVHSDEQIVGASIGIAHYGQTHDPDTLIHLADQALNQHKRTTRPVNLTSPD